MGHFGTYNSNTIPIASLKPLVITACIRDKVFTIYEDYPFVLKFATILFINYHNVEKHMGFNVCIISVNLN